MSDEVASKVEMSNEVASKVTSNNKLMSRATVQSHRLAPILIHWNRKNSRKKKSLQEANLLPLSPLHWVELLNNWWEKPRVQFRKLGIYEMALQR